MPLRWWLFDKSPATRSRRRSGHRAKESGSLMVGRCTKPHTGSSATPVLGHSLLLPRLPTISASFRWSVDVNRRNTGLRREWKPDLDWLLHPHSLPAHRFGAMNWAQNLNSMISAGWDAWLVNTRAFLQINVEGANSCALIRSILYGTSPFDPLVLAAIVGCLLLTAMLACAVPAFRASRIEPMQALRME
jgi:hypothetical protein